MIRSGAVRSVQLGAIAAFLLLGVVGPTAASAAARAAAPNSSLAGYLVTKTKAHIHSASATFKIPTITCKKNESGVGPAVIVETSPNAKTNAFSSDASAVAVACVNKKPVYESIITVNDVEYPNDFTDLQVGDKVVANVTIGPRRTVVTFDDVTRGESETKTGASSKSINAWICATSLAVGDNTGKRQIGIDPFTTLAVSHAQVNGHSLASESPNRYNWVVKGTTLVTASKIKNGGSFTATFKNSN